MQPSEREYVVVLHAWARAYHDHKDRLSHAILAVAFVIFVSLLWPRPRVDIAQDLPLDLALFGGLLVSFAAMVRQTAYKQGGSYFTRLAFLALAASEGDPPPAPQATRAHKGLHLVPPMDASVMSRNEFVPPFLRGIAESIDTAKCRPPYDHMLVRAHFAMVILGAALLIFRWRLMIG